MTMFAVNLILAIVWALATGSLSERNLVFGFVVGMVVLHLLGAAVGDRRYVERLFRIVHLIVIFLRELVSSSVRVTWDVLRPELRMTPAVIMVPLDLTEDAHITLLANLISLTPGTLTIDVADDKRCLYVHAMYGRDPDAVVDEIKRTFEVRIAKAFA